MEQNYIELKLIKDIAWNKGVINFCVDVFYPRIGNEIHTTVVGISNVYCRGYIDYTNYEGMNRTITWGTVTSYGHLWYLRFRS